MSCWHRAARSRLKIARAEVESTLGKTSIEKLLRFLMSTEAVFRRKRHAQFDILVQIQIRMHITAHDISTQPLRDWQFVRATASTLGRLQKILFVASFVPFGFQFLLFVLSRRSA